MKILLLTSQKAGAGGGHRSSSNAIKAAILELNPDADVNDVDAMEFFPGYTGEEQSYTPLTTSFKYIWKVFFEITSCFKGFSNFVLYTAIYRSFKKLVKAYNPDIILSVNPIFVGSIYICLKKMKSPVPLCACIVDLVKHSRLWHEKKCKITFVPTAKMYDLLLNKGFKAEGLVHSGFPISERFNKLNRSPKTEISVPNILMVTPSLKGYKATLGLIMATLEHNVCLTVVTKDDKKLKEYLDKNLEGIENVTVTGYVSDMDSRLAAADVLITKAGPNMILEAVKMCVPVIITDNILGQEEKNHEYITENGYGFKCGSPKELSDTLGRLFEKDYALLKKTSLNQQGCNDTSGAKVVAKTLLEALDGIRNSSGS